MIQIAPESAALHKLLEIPMRSHHHAHIHLGRLVRSDPLHLAFFQYSQKFGLHRNRHVANLVEKKRSAMRLLKLAAVPLSRSGERALFVPE